MLTSVSRANHHRDVSGGGLRAAVFGMSDGLVSNVALVLGVAGADASSDFVRISGIAGLVAGACSMAAGEYISMKSQREVIEFELKKEENEIKNRPEFEQQELTDIYVSHGVSEDLAAQLSAEVMSNPKIALEVHAREELGVNPRSLGSPITAAASSFATFAFGAALPLIPWFFATGNGAIAASVIIASIAALIVGGAIGAISGRSVLLSALRQLTVSSVAAGLTFFIGHIFNTTVG